jgi:Na+/H+ antiporter NhaD/arsenite permease-like protein
MPPRWVLIALGLLMAVVGPPVTGQENVDRPATGVQAAHRDASTVHNDSPDHSSEQAPGKQHSGKQGSGGHNAEDHGAMGAQLPLWSVLPFAALLLSIAIMPLFAAHWWEHNHHQNKAIVAGALAAIVIAYMAAAWGASGREALQHVLMEYVSFILLLGSLFLITGGIYVRGSLNGTPLANTAMMAIGAVIANFIGTTGASVLLVRPLLRANQSRQHKAHIVIFFIFVVSNCGGLLTPLGDPPLFMGFTAGVPFEWTFFNLWPMWLTVNLALLVVFHIWDQIVFAREEKRRAGSAG